MHTETLPLSDCLHFGPDDGTLHQVVKPSTTLYFVGVFLARQPTLTERVHHSATKRGESITVIRRTKAKTDGQTTGVVFKAETTCTDRKCVQTVATVRSWRCQQSGPVIRLAVSTKKMVVLGVDNNFVSRSLFVDSRVWRLCSIIDTSQQAKSNISSFAKLTRCNIWS